MKGDTYYLKNTSTGYVAGVFVVDKADQFAVFGTCYEPVSWDIDTHEPYETYYLADVYCKWDSCTHWYFRGEDYDPYLKTEEDSYYHLCSEFSFNTHIRLMCFVWKLVSRIMTAERILEGQEGVEDNYFKKEEIKALMLLMLDGYEIVSVGKKEFV